MFALQRVCKKWVPWLGGAAALITIFVFFTGNPTFMGIFEDDSVDNPAITKTRESKPVKLPFLLDRGPNRVYFKYRIIDTEDFRFVFEFWTSGSQTTTCSILITNKKSERTLSIVNLNGTRLVDDGGNQAKCVAASFGYSNYDYQQNSDHDIVASPLITNVPTKVTLYFEKLDIATHFTLKLYYRFKGIDFSVTFLKIALGESP